LHIEVGIEEILVSKEVEFFVEQIENPPKSMSGKNLRHIKV